GEAGHRCALLNRAVYCGLCHTSNRSKDSAGPARNGAPRE
ncbi:MAG: hypothetical protein JWN05_1285, partial [Arthrobacter sp.]|nr:hypothetical protein [Arthrobacter sp.]